MIDGELDPGVDRAVSTFATWPLTDFERGAAQALSALRAMSGLSTFVVIREIGPTRVVLEALDTHYGLQAGQEFRHRRLGVSHGHGPVLDSTTFFCVPVRLPDGTPFAEMCALDPDTQSPGDLERLRCAAVQIGDLLGRLVAVELRALEAARNYERARRDATEDRLVGLPNRRGWEDLLAVEEARCRRYGHSGAVVVVDLDRLKEVNDKSGHAAGDDLLVRTAKVLREAARGADLVARLGGDEFGVLAIECGAVEALGLADRLEMALADEGIAASVGSGLRRPTGDLSAAWHDADTAMYKAKRSHGERGP